MHPVSCTNTHDDVTDLVTHGMVENKKKYPENGTSTFYEIKKFLTCASYDTFWEIYCFVAEATFKDVWNCR